ncbi:hypothetical protein E3E38_08810 [Thermococcus sp. 18S1]|uniref:hypothetical protein n=1 Tax=Thermococcus sp. 18S1 TaxID=1638210 RepID=UPI00143CA91D|nr:hypothetical protein [Thermococcus sp. 18S1]NJE31141.1 hypothetical protein [Thermococcus sp. 18S1]
MDLHPLFRIALGFQNAICCGSVTVAVGDDSFTLTRDEIIIDIHDPEKMKKLMDALSPIMGSGEGGMKEKMKMMNEMKLYAEDLASQGKTAIIKYRGNEVMRMGAGANSILMNAFGMRHIEIKYRPDTLRMMKEFM